MNQEEKILLKEGFEAPAPIKKKEFLRGREISAMSNFHFLLSQAGYIRKWVWGLSVLIFAAGFIGAQLLNRDILWCISSCMPLLAMSVITETGRSEVYGMAEFELSTRFSLRSVLLARLCILGMGNMILICLLIPLAFHHGGKSFFQTGVYMLCPYLLTAFLGLWVMRNIHSRESMYLCSGISAGVSVANALLHVRYEILLADWNFIWWLAALIILGTGTCSQSYHMVKQREELVWN